MTDAGSKTPARRGRPRDPGADEAIISAVYDVLADVGFAGFSVEAVATRAGMGKATIYRRWSSREELLTAAAEQAMAQDACPDTGSLRYDLVEWIWAKHRRTDESPGLRLLGQIVAEARSNPDLRRLLQQFHTARRRTFLEMVEHAEARGDVPDSLDPMLLLDLVSGAVLHRSLFADRRVHRVDVEAIVDAALRGVDIAEPRQP